MHDAAARCSGVAKLEVGVDALAEALDVSTDLRDMIASPIVSRAEQASAMSAIAAHLKLTPALARGLGLMAQKRRLFAAPQLISQLRAMIADSKGEVQAEVTSAKALTTRHDLAIGIGEAVANVLAASGTAAGGAAAGGSTCGAQLCLTYN